MTPDLPPLPEPENAAETDGCTYACPEGFTADQLRAHAAEAVRLALTDREFIHAESSRIYSRLAGAVRAGADDAALARMLRAEVDARSKDRK